MNKLITYFDFSKLRMLGFSLCLVLSAQAQTGIAVPGMSNCDASMQSFLNTYNIPGATMALSKNGKLIYLRAFGNANLAGTLATQPYHRFRIASLSKPVTGIAIMKMIENGAFGLNDLVFGPTGLMKNHPAYTNATITDTRINAITVKQLLHHTAGWNRDNSCFPNPTTPYPYQIGGCDPISAPLYITQQTGTQNPVTETALITFLLEKGLDTAPGTVYNYSNIGYLILGEIIAQKTGMTYEAYMQDSIFAPLGICDMEIGQNLLADKQPREGEYKGNGYTVKSLYNTGLSVPWEYGGFNVNAMDAHGGWIATASDLVKLIVAVDGFSTKPDILNAASITTMTTASAQNTSYACGWQVNSFNNWWHTGALDGTASIMARSNNGYTWAIILNKRAVGTQANSFWSDLDNLPWNCISQATSFPNHDLMLTPTQSATQLTKSSNTTTSVNLQWTGVTGAKYIVVATDGNDVAYPLDGVIYTENATYGLGDSLGNNNFVVANGTATSAQISGLAPQKYRFTVYTYTQSAATGNYPLYRLCHGAALDVAMNLSVPENQAAAHIQIFPNPTKDYLTVRNTGNQKTTEISVHNLLGQALFSEKTVAEETRIDMTKMPAGVYFIRVKTGDLVENVRIEKL